MTSHGFPDLFCTFFIELGNIKLAEKAREVRGGAETADYRRTGERVNSPAIFPQIPCRLWKAGFRIPKSEKKIARATYQLAVQGTDQVEVAETIIMFPKRPQDQRSFILLNRHQGTPRARI